MAVSVPPRYARQNLLVVLLLVTLTTAGCNPAMGPKGEGPGHRRQYLALTPQQEFSLGVKAYKQILAEADEKGALLSTNDDAVQRVRRVGKHIEKAVQIKPLQREINLHLDNYIFKWEYNVIRSREVNAFCLPGGKVAVYSGLLRIVQNDDQLATVLSHEIAHALAHHSNERLSRYQESGKIGWLVNNAYDRQQESEADHIGLFLMTFADYDPDQAVVFWQRMRQAQGGVALPEILSDHPSDLHRMKQMRAWVPQAKAAKVAFEHHRIAASR